MAQPLSIVIPHQLGAAAAKARLDAGFDRIEREIAPGVAEVRRYWEGDRMTFKAQVLGQPVGGRLEVLDELVRLEIDLPPVLAVVANAIKGRLKRQTALLLEKK